MDEHLVEKLAASTVDLMDLILAALLVGLMVTMKVVNLVDNLADLKDKLLEQQLVGNLGGVSVNQLGIQKVGSMVSH